MNPADHLDDAGAHATNASHRTDAWVRYLDRVAQLDQMAAVKRRITDGLALRPGDVVLDAGCGTGDDTRAMAALVAPDGRAVGVDDHEPVLAEARRRAAGSGLPVEFVLADVEHLPFADGTFSACRSERMFQHTRDPLTAMRELARVTRSSGQVVVFDTDWETLIVDAADVTTTRAIVQTHCAQLRHGWIGRQLAGLMRQAGLGEITVEPNTLVHRDGYEALALHEFQPIAEQALRQGTITQAQCDAWFADIFERHSAGRFFCAVTQFTVRGRVA
jgi:ubiquinone/menaquinone biosynthesis C-methylase UbiE